MKRQFDKNAYLCMPDHDMGKGFGKTSDPSYGFRSLARIDRMR